MSASPPDSTRHDLRFGGRWLLSQRVKNDAVYLGLRLADALARRLPAQLIEHGLRQLTGAVVQRSAVAHANLARVLPRHDAIQRRAFLQRHARLLADDLHDALQYSWGRRPSAPLPLLGDAASCLREALGEGRGVVLASAHLGPWERVAQGLVAAGLPFTAVVREAYDPRLDRWLGSLRRGVPCIARGSAGATRGMLRVLREGGILGIPMDLATRGVLAVDVRFLGQPTAMVSGPARLALRSGAAVVAATYAECPRQGPGIAVRRLGTAAHARASPADEHALTQRLAQELEALILAVPERWLWMHPRWPSADTHRYTAPHGRR